MPKDTKNAPMYLYGAKTNIGYQRTSQEDYVVVTEMNGDLLAIIGDGSRTAQTETQGGSVAMLQVSPATICADSIVHFIKEIVDHDRDMFTKNAKFFLEQAMRQADINLSFFKIGNEEMYEGYFASMTCCYMTKEGIVYLAHVGNTRLYLLRNGNILQLTKDQTKAQQDVEDGILPIENYYMSANSLRITNWLGTGRQSNDDGKSLIQTREFPLKKGDVVVMTTDGIHYSINSKAIQMFTLESPDCITAADTLCKAAESEKYPDNYAAIVIIDAEDMGAGG